MAHFESDGSYELEVLIRFDAWDCQEKHIKDMGFTTEQIQDMGWSQIGRIEDLVWLSSLMFFQWIGLREDLQETIDFPIKYGAFL